jgi:hypothetical protein
MELYLVRFPKVKREARMRRVITNIRQDPNQVEDKTLRIQLVPVRAGKRRR